MKKISLQIPKNNKYIVACSFGPDSMALLDAAVKQKLNIVVAHVNYHHREESNFEENELRKYCKKHNLKIEILDLLHIMPEGNFEGWARKERYDFFKKVLDKNNADAILVAHHQDDLIETYIMQKKRNAFVKHWGIAEVSYVSGAKILRPFLNYAKKELIDYCLQNRIKFSIDKTNLTDEYERNKIRHQIVEKLTKEKRANLLEEIFSRKPIKITIKNDWSLNAFSKLSYEQTVLLIDHFLENKNEHKNLSKKYVEELKKSLLSKKPNIEINLSKKLMMSKAYNHIYFVDLEKIIPFKISVEKRKQFLGNFISFDFRKSTSDRNIFSSDFPLIIRNSKSDDKLTIKNYSSSVRRLFIDWKMPEFLRKMWPVVENKEHKIIYIPRYREKYSDNHKTKFQINIDELLAK